MRYEDYLSLGEEIDWNENVVCDYSLDTDGSIERAAGAVAAEESTGTWTMVSTESEEVFKKYKGTVFEIQGNLARIAYPLDIFSIDIGSIPQILSVIAGNLFGLEEIRGVRLEDVYFPEKITKQFPGPQFGIDGLRSILNRPEKPLVGTIIKPKIGLSPKQFAEYVYEAGMGGLTNSKDDETLTDQVFCPIEERTRLVTESLDRIKSETGRTMLHAVNVSTRTDKLQELAEQAIEWGAKQLMIDEITCGLSSILALRDDPSINVPIHVHRTMHAAFTRNKKHGVSMTVIAKLTRMAGGDALHIGTFGVGKMKGNPEEDMVYQKAITDEMFGLKRTMPVCSGGMQPMFVQPLVKVAGRDIQVQAGGGVAGHPKGVRAGAKAMVQAVDAAVAGIDVMEYMKDHEELRLAYEKWGR